MRGRARGQQERSIILAHQIEVMARQTRLRPVKYYLPRNEVAAAASGAASVLAMFRRVKARQDAKLIEEGRMPHGKG